MVNDLKARKSALTVRQLAELLSLSEREVYKLAANNQIPHIRIGSSVRFDPPTIAAWIETKTLTPASRHSPSSVHPRHERLPNIA
jgi:excisionase family DNA binding protein